MSLFLYAVWESDPVLFFCMYLFSFSNTIYWRDCLYTIVLGWPKSPYGFFHKIKNTFFIFTNNFIDLDILSMSAISWVV